METYAVLQVVWWLLLGVLMIALAVMVGMDMGVGTILRYIGRTDTERRVILRIIGPHWEGNQIWFVLGGELSLETPEDAIEPGFGGWMRLRVL